MMTSAPMFVEQEQKARCSQVGLAGRQCIRFAFGFLKVRRPIALASSKRCPCPELVAGNPVGEAAPSPHCGQHRLETGSGACEARLPLCRTLKNRPYSRRDDEGAVKNSEMAIQLGRPQYNRSVQKATQTVVENRNLKVRALSPSGVTPTQLGRRPPNRVPSTERQP